MSDPQKQTKAEIDLIASIVLMLIGIFVFYHSIILPRPNNAWLTAPGLVPLALSVSLFFCALYLMVITIKRVQKEKREGKSKGLFKDIKISINKELILVVAITFLFIFVLLERLYFEFASTIYCTLIVRFFWPKAKKIWVLLLAMIIIFVSSAIVCVLFANYLGVLLPGDSFVLDLIFYIGRM